MEEIDHDTQYLARRLNGEARSDGILISADVARSILAERELAEGMAHQSRLLKQARGPVLKVDKNSILFTDTLDMSGASTWRVIQNVLAAARAMRCKIMFVMNDATLMVAPRMTAMSIWTQFLAHRGDDVAEDGPFIEVRDWDKANPRPRF